MSLLKLSDLRSQVKTNLRQPGLSNGQLDTWINLAQDDIATYLDPQHLITPYTFTSVASTRKYYLDEIEFLKILSLRDATNDIDLSEESMQNIEAADPSYTTTGTSYNYALVGFEYVRAQPSAAGVITVVSSSASDTSQTVRVNGLISGKPDTETFALNGTTTVTGTKTWDAGDTNTLSIFSAVKDAVTVGRVTVARSDTLAIIAPNAFMEERQPIYLWPEPTAANTYRGHALRRPRKMVNADDFPDYPPMWHEGVLIDATIKGHLSFFNFKAAGEYHQRYFLPWIARLKANQANSRGKLSGVIRGSTPSASYPTWNVPTLTGPA